MSIVREEGGGGQEGPSLSHHGGIKEVGGASC